MPWPWKCLGLGGWSYKKQGLMKVSLLIAGGLELDDVLGFFQLSPFCNSVTLGALFLLQETFL